MGVMDEPWAEPAACHARHERELRRPAFEADGYLDKPSGALGRLAAYRNADALAAIGDPRQTIRGYEPNRRDA